MKDYSHKEVVKKVEKTVEAACKKQSNIYGYDAWKHHILPVVKYSKMLAKKLGADEKVVELAALLHDYGAINGDPDEHHISGVREAEKILKKLNYPQGKIEEIKHCIYAHRGSRPIKRETIEAEIIASADAMAHFEDIPSLFYLVFTKHKLDIEEGVESLRSKLERDWKKLMPQAREMIEAKYETIKRVLK